MKPARNDLCPCGSGKQYKRCCRLEPAPVSATETLNPHEIGALVRIATGPISEGATDKGLLIDRFQQHHNGPLRDLVLERRYAQPALPTTCFVYVVTSHWRRTVPARFESIDQPEEVLPQIYRIPFRRLTIHPHRTVLARALVRILHPFHIEIVIQRGERHRRVRSCQCGYPLLFR